MSMPEITPQLVLKTGLTLIEIWCLSRMQTASREKNVYALLSSGFWLVATAVIYAGTMH